MFAIFFTPRYTTSHIFLLFLAFFPFLSFSFYTIGKLFERALARDEQLGLLGEWSEDIDCVRPLYFSCFSANKRTTKRGIGERWRSGGRISLLDTSALEACNNCGSGLTEKV
jgi:hypothetical protein